MHCTHSGCFAPVLLICPGEFRERVRLTAAPSALAAAAASAAACRVPVDVAVAVSAEAALAAGDDAWDLVDAAASLAARATPGAPDVAIHAWIRTLRGAGGARPDKLPDVLAPGRLRLGQRPELVDAALALAGDSR